MITGLTETEVLRALVAQVTVYKDAQDRFIIIQACDKGSYEWTAENARKSLKDAEEGLRVRMAQAREILGDTG